MPEALASALAEPGLIWVCAAALLAGLVHGFAGFGAALIFMPLATIVLSPALAVAAFSVSALATLVTMVPGAWKVADRRAVLLMLGASVMFAPLGVLALRLAPSEVIRAVISGLTLVTLTALIVGWRVPVAGGRWWQAGAGALAGVTGASTGLNGPPVILINLGTDQPVAVTRGNLACFLTFSSLAFLPQLWLQGLLPPRALWIGVVLFVPYFVGTGVGTWVFNPAWASAYRRFAYALIAAAGIAGLPLWG